MSDHFVVISDKELKRKRKKKLKTKRCMINVKDIWRMTYNVCVHLRLLAAVNRSKLHLWHILTNYKSCHRWKCMLFECSVVLSIHYLSALIGGKIKLYTTVMFFFFLQKLKVHVLNSTSLSGRHNFVLREHVLIGMWYKKINEINSKIFSKVCYFS